MKSLKLGLTCILLLSTTLSAATVMAAEPNSIVLSKEVKNKTTSDLLDKYNVEVKPAKKVNRAKVVNMTVELELPDGSTVIVDNINFCTPGGFYNGVQALVFGDEAVKIMQAGMAALYPKTGDSVNQLWQNKSHADDPRLPTYLMIRAPDNQLKKNKAKQQGDAKNPITFGSSAKTYKLNDKTPTIMSSCGGYYHPPSLTQ